MKVSAIVVTYNRLQLLKECIWGLLNQDSSLDRIFIVNNDSVDGTKKYLNSINNKKFFVKNLNKNIGGAGGFNLGLKLAYKYSKSNYFWIMDDDTIPTQSSLTFLLSKAKLFRNDFGFLCSNVRWYKDRTACNIPHVSRDWPQMINKSVIKVSTATFVSLLIPRIRVRQMGLPIKEMFIWGDDTEYTTRLSQKFNCYFVPDSIVLHKSLGNKSYETIFNVSLKRINFYKYMYRNLIYIDRKYYSITRLVKDIIRFLIDLIKIPFNSNNHRLFRMYCTFIGTFQGLFFNPKIQTPKF